MPRGRAATGRKGDDGSGRAAGGGAPRGGGGGSARGRGTGRSDGGGAFLREDLAGAGALVVGGLDRDEDVAALDRGGVVARLVLGDARADEAADEAPRRR